MLRFLERALPVLRDLLVHAAHFNPLPRAMRKQLDPRIPALIANGVRSNHRSFFVMVGDRGRDQVSTSQATTNL